MGAVPSPAPGGRALTRKAGALGVALALHGLLAVAWGEGFGGHGTALPSGAGPAALPTVAWLRLLPAEAPAAAVEPAPAADAEPTPVVPAEAAAQAPGAPAAAAAPLPGQLVQHGAVWSPGYPDADLGAARVVLRLALQLDAVRRVQSAEAATVSARPELVQFVSDQLLGATLDEHPAAPGEPVCLEVSFDAAEARATWRFVAPDARTACGDGRTR